ncbi:MAG: tetratricopeptide repeat protein [Chitinophagales bacterium]
MAVKHGLAGNELADCFLGLGSSYRMLKDYKKSIQVFLEAINIFPNNNELKLFLSFTYFENNELKKAYSSLLILLTLVHKDDNLLAYKNAINSYLEKISI